MGKIRFNVFTKRNKPCVTADPLVFELVQINIADDVTSLRRLLVGPQTVAERNLKLSALMRDVRR